MADDYYIDITHPRAPARVGADDYAIVPQHLAGRPAHGHGGRGGYWQRPLFYTLDFGDVPVNVSQGDPEIPDAVGFSLSDIGHAVSSVGRDIVHATNTAVTAATKAVGSVPLVGKPLAAGLALNPISLTGGFVAKVASGENVLQSGISTLKNQLAAAKEVAPYVQAVVGFVPGVGTGISAAIAAGTALASGRTMSDALISAIKGAVPGGALGQIAFQCALDVSKGNSITSTALDAAISQLPPAAQSAARVAVAAAKGKNVRDAVLTAVMSAIPDANVRRALSVGLATGIARNCQSAVVAAVSKPGALAKLAASIPTAKLMNPPVAKAKPADPTAAAGYTQGIALLAHTGVTPHAVAAGRASLLNPVARAGFDHAVATVSNLSNPGFTSLVRGGLVVRGNWKGTSATDKNAVLGRLITNGKVTKGYFSRV